MAGMWRNVSRLPDGTTLGLNNGVSLKKSGAVNGGFNVVKSSDGAILAQFFLDDDYTPPRVVALGTGLTPLGEIILATPTTHGIIGGGHEFKITSNGLEWSTDGGNNWTTILSPSGSSGGSTFCGVATVDTDSGDTQTGTVTVTDARFTASTVVTLGARGVIHYLNPWLEVTSGSMTIHGDLGDDIGWIAQNP